MKRLIVILLVLGVGGGALVWAVKDKPEPAAQSNNVQQEQKPALSVQESKNGEPTVIAYTDNGFSQPEIRIRIGTTLKWINQRLDDGTEQGRPMWVASDIHPEHTIYPEFDQAYLLRYEPLPSDSTYQFTFNKPGRWEYHDHYDPGMKGIVIVER